MDSRPLALQDPEPSVSSDAKLPSDSHADEQFFISFGLILSCRLADVEKIRSDIQNSGGKIVFQTVSNGSLFLLRARHIEKILHGDLSEIAEIYEKKERRSEK